MRMRHCSISLPFWRRTNTKNKTLCKYSVSLKLFRRYYNVTRVIRRIKLLQPARKQSTTAVQINVLPIINYYRRKVECVYFVFEHQIMFSDAQLQQVVVMYPLTV